MNRRNLGVLIGIVCLGLFAVNLFRFNLAVERAEIGKINDDALLTWMTSMSPHYVPLDPNVVQKKVATEEIILRHFSAQGVKDLLAVQDKVRALRQADMAADQPLRSRPNGEVSIAEKGDFQGTYRWIVDVPMTVSFDDKASPSVNIVVRYTVARLQRPDDTEEAEVRQVSLLP